MILAPIKRPLSTKNTSPSQKSAFILQGHHPVTGSAPFLCLRPWFQKLSVRILNWSATRHPSGSRPIKKKRGPIICLTHVRDALKLLPESCTNYLLWLEALCLLSSFHGFVPHHIGNMVAGQNHSNFALNTRLSAPRYDTWCKIQVLSLKDDRWARGVDACEN